MEQSRKTWLMSIILLILLIMTFLFAGNVVSAASAAGQSQSGPEELSRLKKTPYVKGKGTLVLRFADFSSKGYYYTVTNEKTGKKADGQLRAGKGVLTVNLKNRGLFSDNTGYKLEVESKDHQAKVTTRYFTAKALSDIVVTQNADNSLVWSWKLSGQNVYNGFLAMASRKENPVQPEIHEFVVGGSKKIDASKFSPGTWYVSGIAYKIIGKYRYYGERVLKKAEYGKSVAKVTGLIAKKGSHSAILSWNSAAGASWYMVYMKSGDEEYRLVKDHVTGTSCKVSGLKSKKKYTFSIRAVYSESDMVRISGLSNPGSVKTPKTSGDIRKIVLAFNMDKKLCVKWNKVKGASLYRVYWRKTGEESYKLLGKTKKTIYSLEKLDGNTSYDIVAYTVSKDNGVTYQSPDGSNVITFTPSTYIKENNTQLLASMVRTIGYHRGYCDYTTRKYTSDVKHAYVNYKKFSSKTKYLIWVSHYTQQTTIFKGSKGKWKMIRTFTVGTGKASTRSPRGSFRIFRKESGWYYNYSKELYVSHYAGKNSFHTRPLYNNGSVATATIGRPCSHGCVRCYNKDARFIYKNIPIGTKVISY